MKISKSYFYVLTLLMVSSVFTQAQHFTGDVFGTWDADTIYVDGNIDVPLNKSLVITPGTYVYFTGEYKFDVYGTLTAKGTETDSIFFCSDSLGETSTYPNYAGFWYGIVFHSTDVNEQPPSSLDYCNIKYAYPTWLDEMMSRYGGGLVFYKSQVNVAHTTLTDCLDENLDKGVFTAIYSNGNIDGVSLLKTTSYRAGTMTLLSSDININNLYMFDAYGFYIDSSKVKIQNSKIDSCSPYIQWGIVNTKNSEVEITDCEIINNNGIGIFAKFSNLKTEHTLIKNNSKEGGIFIESPSTFSNCEIIGNGLNGLRFQTVQNWGTIFTSKINNCVIAKNKETGIKFFSRNNADIVNCTIADNNSTNGWGGIINGEVDTHLKNCIVWNNGNNLDFQAGGFYTYSIIQGGYVGEDTAKTNQKNIDPLFRDAANGDYHLQSTACGSAANSPGIDAGDPTIGDLLLNCEFAGLGAKRSDIGAYGGADNWWDKELLPPCHFSGNVSGVWECEEIYVDGDIIIPQGDTLEIKESVKWVLITGPYQIKVEGVLLAVGPQNDITNLNGNFLKFQGKPEKGNEWKGIIFNNLNDTNVGTSVIENCRFDYASKLNTNYQGGGAVYINNSDNVTIKHSTFFANVARLGGAICLVNSNAHIEDCYFDSNGKQFWTREGTLTQAGGAMWVRTSNPYLHKLHFVENHSITGGGAMLVDNSSITITNILAVKNETTGMGGAIEAIASVTGSHLKIANMTSADNIARDNGGGTFHTNGENTELEVVNSIMYGNTKSEIFSEGKVPVITYSIIDSGYAKPYYGIGCLDKDPMFTGFYQLSSTACGATDNSDGIDMGHPDSLDAVLDCNEGLGTSRADMGFYGGRYSEMTVGINDEAEAQTPNEYALAQNYPNPFNPSTTINFSIPQSGMVSLKIYNILGEEVATLINKEMNAGLQSVNFDAGNLSSGLYLYRLQASNFISVRKMLLVK